MHVLITGVGGFVGSRLARHLLARGDRVSGTYVDARPDLEGVELSEADLLDRAALERAVRQASPDAIVHLAGLSHIGESWDWQRMADYFWVNVAGTESVLTVAAAAGNPPVVIASSADVYGTGAGERAADPRVPPRGAPDPLRADQGGGRAARPGARRRDRPLVQPDRPGAGPQVRARLLGVSARRHPPGRTAAGARGRRPLHRARLRPRRRRRRGLPPAGGEGGPAGASTTWPAARPS